jgi:hypothetical protein
MTNVTANAASVVAAAAAPNSVSAAAVSVRVGSLPPSRSAHLLRHRLQPRRLPHSSSAARRTHRLCTTHMHVYAGSRAQLKSSAPCAATYIRVVVLYSAVCTVVRRWR